jgi:23S rRNA pseudouridine1911/1915/1917 synthase
LDRDTSGVLILAKDSKSLKRMQRQFKRREVRKTYLALVDGKMRYKNGVFDAPIIRHPKRRKLYTVSKQEDTTGAREAVTEYSLIYEFADFSYVRLHPVTGRTHQIRVHLRHNGTPVLGDPLYGDASTMDRLALHAASVEFTHPESGNRILVTSPLPTDMRNHMRGKFPARSVEPPPR